MAVTSARLHMDRTVGCTLTLHHNLPGTLPNSALSADFKSQAICRCLRPRVASPV